MSRATVGSAQTELEGLRNENRELRVERDKMKALLEWITAVSGKTFARRGDAASLADDEAVHMVLGRIEEDLGEEFVKSNENKKLTSRRR